MRQFAAAGGSIAYLGGNGFAGKVAFRCDLMELRRSPLEAGRTWDGPIAEQSLSITNQPGGHLRASGRGEFSLTGVAISLMGFDSARPFTRTSQSYEASAAWLFDGVANETFGDEGILLVKGVFKNATGTWRVCTNIFDSGYCCDYGSFPEDYKFLI